MVTEAKKNTFRYVQIIDQMLGEFAKMTLTLVNEWDTSRDIV